MRLLNLMILVPLMNIANAASILNSEHVVSSISKIKQDIQNGQ